MNQLSNFLIIAPVYALLHSSADTLEHAQSYIIGNVEHQWLARVPKDAKDNMNQRVSTLLSGHIWLGYVDNCFTAKDCLLLQSMLNGSCRQMVKSVLNHICSTYF